MLFFSLTTEDEDVIHVDVHYALSMSSLKMSFIIVWKVAGLFVKLKNMTKVQRDLSFS